MPITASGGIWTVKKTYFLEGTTYLELKIRPVTFRLIPSVGLVLPTSAEITVNLSQVQLLRKRAVDLQVSIQELKSTAAVFIQTQRDAELPPLLQRNLTKYLDTLENTQSEFLKLATSEAQRPNADVFFDDLRGSYEDAISHLRSASSLVRGERRFLNVSDKKRGDGQIFLPLALRPMEQNELAYQLVADQGSLTFDLEVDSDPEGAAVTYNRRGDPPRANADPTRSTLHSLPYAIWIIHFAKPGYRTEEREHDPFREPNHVVHVELKK